MRIGLSCTGILRPNNLKNFLVVHEIFQASPARPDRKKRRAHIRRQQPRARRGASWHYKNVLWPPRERFVADTSAAAALGDAEDSRIGGAIWVRLEARWQQLDERRHGWHGVIACDRICV